MMKKVISSVCFLMLFVSYAAFEARAQFENVPFTYQGSLKDGGAAANGNYQMVFEFFTVPAGGTPFLSVSNPSIPVTNGIFSVTFTGGTSQFVPGGTVWIETSVRRAGSTDPFTPLAPRQRIAYAPLAISSLLAGDSQRLGGVEANQYLTAASGGTSFIRNQTAQQSASNFNISGNGFIGGNGSVGGNFGLGTTNPISRMQIADNGLNIGLGGLGCGGGFAGFSIFSSTDPCANYRLLGNNVNTYLNRPTGGWLLFRMNNVDQMVLRDTGNLGLGTDAPIFRMDILAANTGLRVRNTTAGGKVASFGGTGAFEVDSPSLSGGRFAVLENGNVGIGTNAPITKFEVIGNGTFSGNLSSANLAVNGSGIFSGNVGIGNVNPTERLQVSGNGTFTGNLSAVGNLNVNGNINLTKNSGIAEFFMKAAGAANGINLAAVGNAGSNSTFYIAQYDGTTYQDRLILDQNGVIVAPSKMVVGAIAPAQSSNVRLEVNGWLSLGLDGNGTTPVCRNANTILAFCSSSIRYKQNVQNYTPGLDLVRRLRPVTFNWKANNEADFGLVAEETAEVEPLLTTRNDKGETEGVKYDRVGVVLVNAVNEQQAQIETLEKKVAGQNETIERQAEELKTQREKIERQQAELDTLKRLVCSQNPSAELCQPKKED